MAMSRFSDSDISDTSWCQDLDMLHDVEVLGRSLVEALEPKLKQSGALAKSASNTCMSTKSRKPAARLGEVIFANKVS
jgi:hypothetical protein